MFDLSNKVALVTGARRGMGKADALALAQQGATVVVTDISLTECEVVSDEIVQIGGKAMALEMDVSKSESIDVAIQTVIKEFGRLDILVNNAGIYQPKSLFDISVDDWHKTVTINLTGQFLVAQRAAKEMVKNKWGRIINISSISSGGVGVGVPASVHYTATKGGIIGMTEALAVDLAPHGILVNAIAPGGIDTPMANPEGKSRKDMDAIMGRSLLKRIGAPQEVASAVVFLASEESSYITGSTIYVDGGWLAN